MAADSYADGTRTQMAKLRWVKLVDLPEMDYKTKPNDRNLSSFDLLVTNFNALFGSAVRPFCDIGRQSKGNIVMDPCGRSTLASIGSSLFGRKGLKDKVKNVKDDTDASKIVPYSPQRGTYAYDVLQRRFKELDKDSSGYLTEGEVKLALKKLNLPASEKEVQGFMRQISEIKPGMITFEQFARFVIDKENQLFDTFRDLDKRKTGYLTVRGIRDAMHKYQFRMSDKEIEKMVETISVRDKLLGSPDQEQVFDFADYRDFLMISTRKDLRDPFQIWGLAKLDIGGIGSSIPMSSGKHNRKGRLGQPRPFQQLVNHFVASAISSTIARTIVSPLERIKVLFMVNKRTAAEGINNVVNDIWRYEGARGLFKGNFLNILSIAPTKTIQLLVYNNLKELKRRNAKLVDISTLDRMYLGSVACMAAALVLHPIDTVRTVLMSQIGGEKGIAEVASSIVSNRGFLGFYDGFVPHLIKVAPYGAISFSVYDCLKEWHRRKIGPGGDLEALPTMLFGILAAAAAQTAVHPLETVQRRLQVQAAEKGPLLYKTMVNAFSTIVQEEGLGALYAGLLTEYMKIAPAVVISFLLYERFQRNLDKIDYASGVMARSR